MPSSFRSPLAWALLLGLLALSSCAPRPTAHAPAEQAPAAPLVEAQPLAEHIPAAGLRWLVYLEPRKLLENKRIVDDWSPVFQADRLKAFTTASGLQLERIRQVWIAGYDLGLLYLFDAEISGNTAEEAFRSRALTSQDLKTDYANLVHVTGMIEQTPHALIHVRGHLAAVAVGDIRLARVVRAYAEGKLKKSPPALGASSLAPLAAFGAGAPIRAFLVGPFENATDAVAASFVSGALAVRYDNGQLHIRSQALGLWPGSTRLSQDLTGWTDQLLSTREFRALGWGFPTVPPEVSCGEPGSDDAMITCHASGTWNSKEMAQALYRLTSGSMAEIVSEAPAGWKATATTSVEPGQTRASSPSTDPEQNPSGDKTNTKTDGANGDQLVKESSNTSN